MRDRDAVQLACRRLQLAEPAEGEAKVFTSVKRGLLVHLKEWEFPIVCDLPTGQVEFDNFEGNWGERKRLDEFLQAYAVERATLEARKKGHSVVEQPIADGSIKLMIGVAGEVR